MDDPIWPLFLIVGVAALMYGIRVFNGETSWGSVDAGLDNLEGDGGLLGSRHLRGVHRGVPVEVYSERKAEGGHHRFYVVYEAELDTGTVPLGFALGPERAAAVSTGDGLKFDIPGVVQKLGTPAGLQDIQVGDDILDDTFVIKGENPGEVRRYLRDPEISSAIMELAGPDFHSVHVYDGVVEVRQRGGPAAAAVMEQYLDKITACVRVMQGQPAEPAAEEAVSRAAFVDEV